MNRSGGGQHYVRARKAALLSDNDNNTVTCAPLGSSPEAWEALGRRGSVTLEGSREKDPVV